MCARASCVPIAVTTAKRSPELPDVPTVAEAGVPGYEATSWFGLWTQAKTPAAVQQRLYTAIAKVLKDPGRGQEDQRPGR